MAHVISTRERLGIAAFVAARAMAPTTARAQMPRPLVGLSNSVMVLRDSVVALARAQLGKKYRMGGTSPERGFDCSGLVKYVLSALDVDVPRTSREQSHIGEAIPRDTLQLRPGDLLMFGKPKAGVSHVGIYVGNGRYIHASSIAGRVIESPLDRPPSALIKVFKTARRIFGGDSLFVATTVAAKNP
jgi:cell wall-associated NlpC family hydrolase